MAPGLRHLFIDCICPHHHIITSNHTPRRATAVQRLASPGHIRKVLLQRSHRGTL